MPALQLCPGRSGTCRAARIKITPCTYLIVDASGPPRVTRSGHRSSWKKCSRAPSWFRGPSCAGAWCCTLFDPSPEVPAEELAERLSDSCEHGVDNGVIKRTGRVLAPPGRRGGGHRARRECERESATYSEQRVENAGCPASVAACEPGAYRSVPEDDVVFP